MNAVLDLFRVLWEPGAVFERARERPRVLVPLLVIIGLSVALGLLAMPYVRAGMAAVMAQRPQGAGAAPDPGTLAMFQFIGTAVFLPIYAFLGAGVLWIVVSLFGEQGSYRHLLSVVTYAMILYILQVAAGVVVLALRGVESITSPQDLQPAFGLDLVFTGATGYLGAVLKGINVFSIWGVVVQGIGITKTHNTSRETGYAAAAVAFVIILLVVSLFALLRP
ncbi:MAG: YIP1 family protein [Gemmatimonadales bacterium]